VTATNCLLAVHDKCMMQQLSDGRNNEIMTEDTICIPELKCSNSVAFLLRQ
jgi:hypothetical protein